MKLKGRHGLASLTLLSFAGVPGPAAAAAERQEYRAFESVCAVVQLEATPTLQRLFVAEELEADLGRAVSDYFAAQGTAWPVELGSACLPRNVSTSSKQLSLVFHVTLTDQLPPSAVTGAAIVHTVFALDLHLPHDYPTSLFACVGGDDPRTCVAGSLASYFATNIVPLIEEGQSQRDAVAGAPAKFAGSSD